MSVHLPSKNNQPIPVASGWTQCKEVAMDQAAAKV